MSKRLAKIEMCEGGYPERRYWYRLVGGNGEIMFVSEAYTRRQDSKRAMRRAIQIIQSGQYRVEE